MSYRCLFGFHRFRTGRYEVSLKENKGVYLVSPICTRCHMPDLENIVTVVG